MLYQLFTVRSVEQNIIITVTDGGEKGTLHVRVHVGFGVLTEVVMKPCAVVR
jgi:hypothetical protein